MRVIEPALVATLSGLIFGETYRLRIAGVDDAGNVGPLSDLSVIGQAYDLICVDALNYADSFSAPWELVDSATASGTSHIFSDTGGGTRPAPSALGSNARFYRAAPTGKWTTGNSPRLATCFPHPTT